jgi:hypothetical protein
MYFKGQNIEMRARFLNLLRWLCLGLVFTTNAQAQSATQEQPDESSIRFVSLLFTEGQALEKNIQYLTINWQPGFESMAVEVIRLARRDDVIRPLYSLLRKHTGNNFKDTLNGWYQWLWNRPEKKYLHYAQFKSLLNRLIDKRFADYFDDSRATTIRLDEIVWGGVKQDGIPPLRQPKMISIDEATYLADDNVVFGIKINGDARAYPKRLLAWHEMFIDEIGGTEFAGVYCTLCGAMILYETKFENSQHELGTSGFLYRSNKLMYDKATQSLWNTTWGQPVVGPMVDKGITLKRSYVVTTTWGEWKRRHPDTIVLSLETGHDRDYDEGVAYRDYFSTDALMFEVPKIDTRLKNKDEVLALVFPEVSKQVLAIHADFLQRNPVYHDQIGSLKFVVLSDRSGANRVYNTGKVVITDFDEDQIAIDSDGEEWVMAEDSLTSSSGQVMPRLAAHRAFWFGWYAANNDTRLVY